MKTVTVISLLAFTILTGSVVAHAADRNGGYIVFGRGREVCAAHVTADNFEVNARNWFAGFMSSFNIYQPETFDITGTDTSWHLWLVEYCRLNPTLTLADAAKAFIGVYYDTRLIQAVPTITPPARQPNLAKTRGLTRDRSQY